MLIDVVNDSELKLLMLVNFVDNDKCFYAINVIVVAD